MEATGEAKMGSLLEIVQPPLLEDAGLEDCALPPDSIQEAFLKGATAVRSRFFHASDDESEGECVNHPWPGNVPSGDKLAGITTGFDPPGACAPKKGGELQVVSGDKVAEPEVPDEPEKSCVDGLQGLKIGVKNSRGEINAKNFGADTKSNEDDKEDNENRPV